MKLLPNTPEEEALLSAHKRGAVRPEFLKELVASMANATRNETAAALPPGVVENAETIVKRAEVADPETETHIADLYLYSSGKVKVTGMNSNAASYAHPKVFEFLKRAEINPIPCPKALEDFLLKTNNPTLTVAWYRDQAKENSLKQLLEA